MSNKRRNIHRQRFFDTSVHIRGVQDCMTGKSEEKMLELLEYMGYVNGRDFVRQHPVGDRFVCDFAFVNEQVAIEVDGKGHREKRQKKIDAIRDRFFLENNWEVIRVQEDKMSEQEITFYKSLIRMVVSERTEQFNNGDLYTVDIKSFNKEDYE